jgi:hypothetical protein
MDKPPRNLQPAATTCKGDAASIASGSLQLRHHQQPAGRHFAQRRQFAPAHGIATAAAASPTTPTATTPIHCLRRTACPTPSPTSRPRPIPSPPIPSPSTSTPRSPASVWSPLRSPGAPRPQQCFSQNQQAQLDAQECFTATYNGITNQYELCAPPSVTSGFACPGGLPPGVTSVPECTSSIGTLNFLSSNSSVAKINQARLSSPRRCRKPPLRLDTSPPARPNRSVLRWPMEVQKASLHRELCRTSRPT